MKRNKSFDIEKSMKLFASDATRKALTGFNDGTFKSENYLIQCHSTDYGTGSIILFTRDIGHHSSGWWKNPDYERCWHLSLSFFAPFSLERLPKNSGLTEKWLGLLFGDNKKLLWCEPPHTPQGKKIDVWHYRLFADSKWQAIKPRGEVYTREFTKAGWKSYSDVQAEEESKAKNLMILGVR